MLRHWASFSLTLGVLFDLAWALIDNTRCCAVLQRVGCTLDGRMRKFDVVIIGFPKAGTSSLAKFLRMHQGITVFGPSLPCSEVSCDRQAGMSRAYEHSEPKAIPEPREDRPGGLRVVRMELAIYRPFAIHCLRLSSPWARFLVMVREPVAWLQAMYNYIALTDTYSTLPSFWEVLTEGATFGISQINGAQGDMHRFLDKFASTHLPGLGHGSLRRLTNRPKTKCGGINRTSRLLVIDVDSLQESPKVVTALVCFLGLRRPFPPNASNVLTNPQHFLNVNARMALQVAKDVITEPGPIDLCRPRHANVLHNLLGRFAGGTARLRDVLLSRVGAGVVSSKMQAPLVSLCGSSSRWMVPLRP